jgi:hypothetical protein
MVNLNQSEYQSIPSRTDYHDGKVHRNQIPFRLQDKVFGVNTVGTIAGVRTGSITQAAAFPSSTADVLLMAVSDVLAQQQVRNRTWQSKGCRLAQSGPMLLCECRISNLNNGHA